jgi:hypothetical protein
MFELPFVTYRSFTSFELFICALGSHAGIKAPLGKDRKALTEFRSECEKHENGKIRVAFFSTAGEGEHTGLVYKYVPEGYRGKKEHHCAFMDNVLGMRLW